MWQANGTITGLLLLPLPLLLVLLTLSLLLLLAAALPEAPAPPPLPLPPLPELLLLLLLLLPLVPFLLPLLLLLALAACSSSCCRSSGNSISKAAWKTENVVRKTSRMGVEVTIKQPPVVATGRSHPPTCPPALTTTHKVSGSTHI